MLRRIQDSKLGAGVPRHAAWLCRAAHLGKGGASPARCIPPEQRRVTLHRQSREPCSPDTSSVRLSRPTPRPNRAPVGCRQRHVTLHRQSGAPCSPDTPSVRLSRPTPRPNRAPVGCRQRRVTLHRQSGAPCSPDTPSVRLSRPTPRRKTFRLSTPDQARAAWIGASARRWTRPAGDGR